ncbi:MAG: TSUP family transporter [Pseudodesulfovibrio sp.]
MTAHVVIFFAALVTSGVTLYSGFGLGTLLLPVYALFCPPEVAVASTALVHGANNLFKLIAVGRHADRGLVLRFGLPAVVAAFAGALALGYVAHFGAVASYTVGGRAAVVTPVKLAMAGLMAAFALLELLPGLKGLRFDRKYLFVGGLLSGFFGGFSGHQGALRAAFLAKVGVSAQAYVGTNAVIGFLVDMTRIAAYAAVFATAGGVGIGGGGQWPLVATGVAAAFLGVILARRYLHKATMGAVQALAGVFLLGTALALGLGLI